MRHSIITFAALALFSTAAGLAAQTPQTDPDRRTETRAEARAAARAQRAVESRDARNADRLYDQARELVDEGRFDRAIERFTRIADAGMARADAALYWKAYSLGKLGQRADALVTLGDLQKRFADSRWLKDAQALDVELRQAEGQAVSPDAQTNEELKLLALRGIMQSDPDRAIPMIEKMLAGSSSVKVKDRALFVLTQSRMPRAREAIAGVAKGNGNPDLQLRAIRYIGMMNGTESPLVLEDVYRGTSDVAVKRAVLRSLMMSGDRARLLAIAKADAASELREEAVQMLGALGAQDELLVLVRADGSIKLKTKIVLAVGVQRKPGAGAALTSIYASETAPEIRKAVLQALFVQGDAKSLVDLARNEKNVDLKKEIVSRLSVMKAKEATDYLMELLK